MSDFIENIEIFLEKQDEDLYSNLYNQPPISTPNPSSNSTYGFHSQAVELQTPGQYSDEYIGQIQEGNFTPEDSSIQLEQVQYDISQFLNLYEQTPNYTIEINTPSSDTPIPNGIQLEYVKQDGIQTYEEAIQDFENPDENIYTNIEIEGQQNISNQEVKDDIQPIIYYEPLMDDNVQELYEPQVEAHQQKDKKKQVKQANGEEYQRATKKIQKKHSKLWRAQTDTLTYFHLFRLCKRSQKLKQSLKQQGTNVTMLLDYRDVLNNRPKTLYDFSKKLRKAHLNGLKFEFCDDNWDINDPVIKQYWDDKTAKEVNQVPLQELKNPKKNVLEQLQKIFNEEVNRIAEERAQKSFQQLSLEYIN